MNETLFDVEPTPPPPPAEKLSAERRRTIRQAEALARGRHPLGLALGCTIRLHDEAAPADDRTAPGRRCGNCKFRELFGYHTRSYAKCAVGYTERRGYPRITHGAGTDVRAWWPACRDHQHTEEEPAS